jgi:hypothetical protein
MQVISGVAGPTWLFTRRAAGRRRRRGYHIDRLMDDAMAPSPPPVLANSAFLVGHDWAAASLGAADRFPERCIAHRAVTAASERL